MARHHQWFRFTGGQEPVITVEHTTARAWLITVAHIIEVQMGMHTELRTRMAVIITIHGVVPPHGTTVLEVRTDTAVVPLHGIMVPAVLQVIGAAPRPGATVPAALRATRAAQPLGEAAPDHGTDREVVRAPSDARGIRHRTCLGCGGSMLHDSPREKESPMSSCQLEKETFHIFLNLS